jgi:hypothetical protein
VALYEQIRREYEFGTGLIIGLARKLGVHRWMVREAVRNTVPAQRKKTEHPQGEDGSGGGGVDRSHSGVGPQGTAQAAAYVAADL